MSVTSVEAACARLIAVVGDRADSNTPVTISWAEWNDFVTAVRPPEPVPEDPPEDEPPEDDLPEGLSDAT